MIFWGFSRVEILILITALMLSLSVHEWAHAAAAIAMGDETPRREGRLSLNPLTHIDIVGFIAVLFLGIGWAKPVRIRPENLRHRKIAEILIALAGPASNALLGLLFAKLSMLFGNTLWSGICWILFQVNVVLFVFNALPIPPLDGSHLVTALIPEHYSRAKFIFLYYGRMILPILLLLSLTLPRFFSLAPLFEAVALWTARLVGVSE